MGMNRLPTQTRAQILHMLVEGSSMRATARVTGVSINTVSKLLVDAGGACAEYHDRYMKGVQAERIQCDEIWSFAYAKDKNVPVAKAAPDGAGSVWTWTAIDSDSKTIVSWLVGDRDSRAAYGFAIDLRQRVTGRPQITTDGLGVYRDAIRYAFRGDVDFAQLIKFYGSSTDQRRYSPPVCTGMTARVRSGDPDPRHISTSYVERHNLTMRMSMRRFTRLTNAFSKKVENHCHALALYFVYYNWCRRHKTHGMTPAQAAGLTEEAFGLEWIIDLINNRQKSN